MWVIYYRWIQTSLYILYRQYLSVLCPDNWLSVCRRYILFSLCPNVYRKLEEDHKEKLAALRSELMKEMDQIQQQAGLQREELEAEVGRIREDESLLRDHLSISVKVLKIFKVMHVVYVSLL